jgi:SAM-dependent methyltransferase
MSPTASNHLGQYALATGADAVGRLKMLHKIYSPAGRQFLLEAGLTKGMRVADFGCGSGFVSRMLAEVVGPSGNVVGVDVNGAQIEQARKLSAKEGLTNTSFIEASAYDTGLPRNTFDLVYCRFLLLHLADPGACLREMRDILKPGGILVIEDGDLATAASIPPTALDAFADLFCRLGPLRGVDYSIANRLCHLVAGAGLSLVNLKVHQPADREGENGLLLKWSVQEAGPAFVDAGLISSDRLQRTLSDMQIALEDSTVLVLAPRMSLVCARKLAA